MFRGVTRRAISFFARSNGVVAWVALNSDESARELRERQRRTAQAAAHDQLLSVFGCHQCDSAAYDFPKRRARSPRVAAPMRRRNTRRTALIAASISRLQRVAKALRAAPPL
jgi:hypothetical protein